MPFDTGPLVTVIALLIFGFVGLTILVPAAMAVKRRSRLAGVIAIAIAGAWAYLWLRPEVERAWRAGAVDECSAQLAALPEVFEGRSLLDESAGLSLQVVVQLLTERGLDFVELKPVPMKDGELRWLMPPGHWRSDPPLPTTLTAKSGAQQPQTPTTRCDMDLRPSFAVSVPTWQLPCVGGSGYA